MATHRNTLIVLDYDETYDVDKSLWNVFISLAKSRGHTVVCCSMRMEKDLDYNQDIIDDILALCYIS